MRAWVVVALLAVPASATAQPSPTPGDAQRHLDQGKRLYELQSYESAIAEFEAGYLIEPSAEFLYAIGQAYRMNGDCERAIRSYEATLRAPDGASLADAAQQNIDRCRRALDAAPPPPPPPRPAPPQPPAPVPTLAPEQASPWYRDWVGNSLVLGGAVLLSGGTVAWNIGRTNAGSTHDAQSYDQWLARYHDNAGAETLQRVGVSAMIVGGGVVIAGVLRYVWPRQHVDSVVTRGGATAQLSIEF